MTYFNRCVEVNGKELDIFQQYVGNVTQFFFKIHKYLYLHLTLKANQNYQNNYPTLFSKTVIFIFYADFSFVTDLL